MQFNIPELLEPAFLNSFERGKAQPVTAPGPLFSAEWAGELAAIDRDQSAPSAAARPAFRGILGEMFESFDLAPRGDFRLVGEQIDCSFS